jgi:hypothetical protein
VSILAGRKAFLLKLLERLLETTLFSAILKAMFNKTQANG